MTRRKMNGRDSAVGAHAIDFYGRIRSQVGRIKLVRMYSRYALMTLDIANLLGKTTE